MRALIGGDSQCLGRDSEKSNRTKDERENLASNSEIERLHCASFESHTENSVCTEKVAELSVGATKLLLWKRGMLSLAAADLGLDVWSTLSRVHSLGLALGLSREGSFKCARHGRVPPV